VRRPALALLIASTLLWRAPASAALDAAGTSGATPSIPVAPVTNAPRRLSQTGLYGDDGAVDPRNRKFVPQYPLWTDGAAKARWLRLPENARIDAADADVWRFPPGTTFWKEFSWQGRKVETRMIRREPDGSWLFAAYAWTEDQRDAVLAPTEGVPAAYEIAPGKRHSIPAIGDCTSCHGSSPAIALGFSALQLSDDRDPLAAHAEPVPRDALTLRSLVAERLLTPERTEWLDAPPRIREQDPVARAALGYLSANCGGCHNPRGPLARLDFSLLHDAAGAPGSPEPGRITTSGVTGRYVVPGIEPERSRILAPGEPELSSLVYRMRSRRAAAQMPPVGSVIPDQAGLALVQRWIESLQPPPAAPGGHESSRATVHASAPARPPNTTRMRR
jgi:hypothetical protein